MISTGFTLWRSPGDAGPAYGPAAPGRWCCCCRCACCSACRGGARCACCSACRGGASSVACCAPPSPPPPAPSAAAASAPAPPAMAPPPAPGVAASAAPAAPSCGAALLAPRRARDPGGAPAAPGSAAAGTAAAILADSSCSLSSSDESFWSISSARPSPTGPRSGCLLASSSLSIFARTSASWRWYIASSASLCRPFSAASSCTLDMAFPSMSRSAARAPILERMRPDAPARPPDSPRPLPRGAAPLPGSLLYATAEAAPATPVKSKTISCIRRTT